MDIILLSLITLTLVVISFFKDRRKTYKALKIALKRILKIAFPIFLMILLFSIAISVFSKDRVSALLLDQKQYAAAFIASLAGSVAVMPGFIAFPLAGFLKESGVSYMVISAFTSTLMMVGIITIPVERRYLGLKVSLARNGLYFLIACVVALVTGILYGEVTI